jgi:hypothetical protein
MKILRQEEGQTLVLTALCMTAMLGFLALAIDVGVLFHAKRGMQTAADAAAIAAAQSYMWSQSATTAQGVGKTASSANGYTDGSSSVTVTINVPPTSGPNAGSSGYTEAIVSQPVGTSFMGMFGKTSMTVMARAVAGTPTNGSACIWLMAPSGNGLSVKGNYDIEAPGCGIYVNSPDSNALKVTGNGGTVNAAFLDVVGNNSGNHTTQPTTDTLNAGVRSSPWGNLSGPNYSGSPNDCKVTSALTSITTANVATVSGSAGNNVICFTNAVTIGNGVVLPGAANGVVYVFEQDVTIATGATVTFGSGQVSPSTGCTTNCTFSNEVGATMELAGSATLNQNSNSILNIYAPATMNSPYDGIAILQPFSNKTELQIQFGSNNEVLDGYIYAPGATVFMQDHGGGVTASGIVAATLFEDQSVLDIYTNYDKAHPNSTINRVLVLVE